MANWRSAKAAYQTAVNIKPDEQFARDRLDEVSTLYQLELETLTKEYQKYIADADNYFNGKIYDGAIENYRIAAGILPDETYPEKMIARITKIINDNAITDVNKITQVIPDNTEQKFSFDPLPVNVRKENYILLKARNVSGHDFKMLVNFGVDGAKTGGVVLPVPQGEVPRDYIIRIGGLYKWFSDDNNWLSVYPEGGDVEVGLIRISKSD
jgi:tetratricopeptide (TPR) repeat protein